MFVVFDEVFYLKRKMVFSCFAEDV